ncbi:hypothetical protein P7134_43 [Streptococcus phage P7134]|uniref:Uncharacterized protein n=4 Tax=Moineauvirus TaxID=1623304 RepID=A0A3G8F982_9CAUD|nr:hypothetical protein PP195_gp44 [Streptococcus phage CHPC1027]YP_010645219.1 hypothetical protein PP197_gp44 [Streptococcus phage CHPC1033]YP_010645504.1 hypothetical protein PP203_gp41 [Streptococcus phage CHPC1067]YP_010646987.1 hypothetical protein PP235_gp43 [Streptococcus phage P7134]AZF91847.1 hypothetical protein CHPC1073_0043 [Streptococcus phage CHPC1073]ARU13615.1 hypothetical protein P7134_43 [Streptococcus phage P7134]AZF91318.1 hypothetical protein CHPC1027_0044 [Streptococcus
MKRFEYAGLTKELHQRLTLEFDTLREEHRRTLTKYIMETKKCDRLQARKYFQRFDNVTKERSRMSLVTLNDMREYLTDGLANDIEEYLSKHCFSSSVKCRPDTDKRNAGLPEELFKQYCEEIKSLKAKYPNRFTAYIMDVKGCKYQKANSIRTAINTLYTELGILTPRKVIQLEGLLSRELFGKIAKYVFNKYEWPESLDKEVDRIYLEYRTKGELGRDKESVKRTLFKAISMGL